MKTFVCAAAVAGLLVIAVTSACSSSETTPTPVADGGGDGATNVDSSAPDAATDTSASDSATASDASATCNQLVNDAPEAMAATVKGNAPAPTGGTIAAGKYHLKEFTLYDPDGTPAAPGAGGIYATLEVAGNVMNSVMNFGDGVDRTFSETFTVTGTKLDRMLTCPKPGPDLPAVYSVTGNTLVIYETDPSGAVAGSSYVRQ